MQHYLQTEFFGHLGLRPDTQPIPRPVLYKTAISSERWRELRRTRLADTKQRCERCGRHFADPALLDLHHKTYDRLGREHSSDVELLCTERCHPVADRQRAEMVAEAAVERSSAAFYIRLLGPGGVGWRDPHTDAQYDRWRARKDEEREQWGDSPPAEK